MSTDLYSAEVTEEESRGDHCNHDLYKRNGGRGLNDAQVTIISEAFTMGIKKPASVFEVFQMRAEAIHDAGMSISQLAFDADVFFLNLTGVKHFILLRPPRNSGCDSYKRSNIQLHCC